MEQSADPMGPQWIPTSCGIVQRLRRRTPPRGPEAAIPQPPLSPAITRRNNLPSTRMRLPQRRPRHRRAFASETSVASSRESLSTPLKWLPLVRASLFFLGVPVSPFLEFVLTYLFIRPINQPSHTFACILESLHVNPEIGTSASRALILHAFLPPQGTPRASLTPHFAAMTATTAAVIATMAVATGSAVVSAGGLRPTRICCCCFVGFVGHLVYCQHPASRARALPLSVAPRVAGQGNRPGAAVGLFCIRMMTSTRVRACC